MKTLKILLTLVLIVTINVNSKCQTQIRYYYDDAGNRIERVIYVPPAKPAPNIEGNQRNQGEAILTKRFEETIDNINLQIYPNPTQAQICISVSNLMQENELSIDMFSVGGTQILHSKIENTMCIVDLSRDLLAFIF